MLFRSCRSLLFKFWTLCVFGPPFGGLGTTYDVYLGLIGKRAVDFLLVLIELFSLNVTAEALRAKIYRKSAISLKCGQFDQHIFFFSENYVKWYFDFSSVYSQFTRLTEGQTDRISSLDRVCIPCSAVKIAPLVPEGSLLVVWSSIGLWVVSWVALWVQSFFFAMGLVELGQSFVGLQKLDPRTTLWYRHIHCSECRYYISDLQYS